MEITVDRSGFISVFHRQNKISANGNLHVGFIVEARTEIIAEIGICNQRINWEERKRRNVFLRRLAKKANPDINLNRGFFG